MKIKEAFKKIETYNEIAELTNEDKRALWFADITSCVSFGEKFTDFSEFRKYVRHEYFKDVADIILNSDGWEFNGEKEIVNNRERTLTFELNLAWA